MTYQFRTVYVSSGQDTLVLLERSLDEIWPDRIPPHFLNATWSYRIPPHLYTIY